MFLSRFRKKAATRTPQGGTTPHNPLNDCGQGAAGIRKSPDTAESPQGRSPVRSGSPCEFMVGDVRVVFTRKQVKNINIRVKGPDGHAAVSAPPWVSQAVVERFIIEKMDWIRKRQKALESAGHRLGKDVGSEQLEQWRSQVEADTKKLIAHWGPIMGVEAETLAFRNMKSRWGSCNPKTGRICINIQLGGYPPECLEYVVIHELCHLLERGHGPRFKALMTCFLPDWKNRRALLRP